MAEFGGDLGLRVAPSHSGNKDRAIPIEATLIDVLHDYLASRSTCAFPPPPVDRLSVTNSELRSNQLFTTLITCVSSSSIAFRVVHMCIWVKSPRRGESRPATHAPSAPRSRCEPGSCVTLTAVLCVKKHLQIPTPLGNTRRGDTLSGGVVDRWFVDRNWL